MNHGRLIFPFVVAALAGCATEQVESQPPAPTNPRWTSSANVRVEDYRPDETVAERPAEKQYVLEGAHVSLRHLHVSSEACNVVCPAFRRKK